MNNNVGQGSLNFKSLQSLKHTYTVTRKNNLRYLYKDGCFVQVVKTNNEAIRIIDKLRSLEFEH